MNSGKRRADVQGLRAVAVVAVIFYHAGDLLPGGFLGVDVFFVISGYVITLSIVREHGRAGQVSLADFYRRRVHRLLPALMVMLVVVLSLAALLAPLASFTSTLRTGVGAALVNANHVLAVGGGYFAESSELNPLLHTWSLSVEEQFYLLYPLLLLFVFRMIGRLHWALVAATVAGLAASLVASYLRLDIGDVPLASLAFYSAPTRAWQFTAGALVATLGRRAPGWSGFVGASLVLGSFVFAHEGVVSPGLWAVPPTVGTALALWQEDGRVAAVLSHPVAVRAGDLSYSWYLWHWPAIVFAAALGLGVPWMLAVVGLGSYPIAVASYELVEQRFRHGHRARSRAWLGWVAAGLLGPVLAAVLGSSIRDMVSERSDLVAAAVASDDLHLDLTCPTVSLVDSLSGCRFGASESDLHVVLLGDSNAGHFTESVVAASALWGARTTVVAESACPFADVIVQNGGRRNASCRQHYETALEWVLQHPPDVVLLASAAEIHLGLADREVLRGALVGEAAYEAGLMATISDIQGTGASVAVVQGIPKPTLEADGSFRTVGTCSVVAIVVMENCEFRFDRDEAMQRRQLGSAIEDRIAEVSGSATIDPFDELCPVNPCTSRDSQGWLYRDARHISVARARLLSDYFATEIALILSRREELRGPR